MYSNIIITILFLVIFLKNLIFPKKGDSIFFNSSKYQVIDASFYKLEHFLLKIFCIFLILICLTHIIILSIPYQYELTMGGEILIFIFLTRYFLLKFNYIKKYNKEFL